MIRGSLQDRPWGQTLGALARHGVSGQLSVHCHNARFEIVFERGLVIAASSPGSAERLTTLAFRQALITPAQLAAIRARRRDRRDQLDHRDHLRAGIEDAALLAQDLAPDQLIRLQRQALAASVARTFVFPHGSFTFDREITLPVAAHCTTHVGSLIYHGARMHLGEQRLADAVRALGTRFTVRDRAPLRYFALGDRERSIVHLLLEGASASLLDAIADDGERRIARAAIYALTACGVLHGEAPHPGRLARGTSDLTWASPTAPRGDQRRPRRLSRTTVSICDVPGIRSNGSITSGT